MGLNIRDRNQSFSIRKLITLNAIFFLNKVIKVRFVGCVLHLALPMVIHSEYRTKYPRTLEPMYSVHVFGSCGVPGLESMGTWFHLTPYALGGVLWTLYHTQSFAI